MGLVCRELPVRGGCRQWSVAPPGTTGPAAACGELAHLAGAGRPRRGKTRCGGGEWIHNLVETGQARRIVLVAPTADDVGDVMVEGERDLLAICPPDFRPRYEPSGGSPGIRRDGPVLPQGELDQPQI
jgi:hypothetical protein